MLTGSDFLIFVDYICLLHFLHVYACFISYHVSLRYYAARQVSAVYECLLFNCNEHILHEVLVLHNVMLTLATRSPWLLARVVCCLWSMGLVI